MVRGQELSILLTSAAVLFSISFSASAQLLMNPTDSKGIYEITGADFGNSPKPIVHEDFESGANGEPLIGWELGSSHGSVPVHSTDSSVTGKFSGQSSFTGSNYNSTAEYRELNGIRSAYLSYYVKVQRLKGDPSRNIKLARLSSGYSGSYKHPLSGITLFDNSSNGYFYAYTGEGQKEIADWFGSISDGNWHRIEQYVELSSPPGSATGKALFWIDGNPKLQSSNIVTEWYGDSFQWLTLPYYVAHDPGGDYKVYYDNIALSERQGRIETCSSPKFSECNMPSVADIVSWDNSRVVINIPPAFTDKSQYVYVFDNNGQLINASGISICSDCPAAPQLQLKE